MQHLEVSFKFNIGDMVVDNSTGREGTVSKRYSKLTKVNEEKYAVVVSYTVKPDKKYNQFRVEESFLEEIEYDDMGERIG